MEKRSKMIEREKVFKIILSLWPIDVEAKGWAILGERGHCCPGDDAGTGYLQALKDVKKLLR